MSKIVREIKNVTKGYSNTQIKVRNATSNDPWGPTGTDMSEIARMTFDTNHDFFEIMEMLDRRLNDKGKNWRHVLKALKVLDYCLHEGSAHVVVWAKDNIYIIKTLREFQYIDEEGKDQGLNVRIAAKELTGLILDEERLRNERKDRKSWKARVAGLDEGISSESSHPPKEHQQARRRQQRPARNEDEDLEYRLAIEASKNLAEEEAAKKRIRSNDVEDDDLEKAIRLSKEEEEQRQRELEQTNENTLFDENPTPTQSQPSQQLPQQNWQQGQAVDLFGNPIQSQPTAYLSNVYAQQPGLDQSQYGQQPGGYVQGPVATGWGVPSQFPQPTGFDQPSQQQPQQSAPFLQLQPQNTIQPQNTLQPQQTAFGAGNPFAAASFNPQPTGFLTPDTSNPYGNNQLGVQPQPEALKPMPTGSNNPFAQFTSPQPQSNGFSSVSPQRTAQPTLAQLQQNQPSGYPSTFQQQPQINPADQKHAQLNALLATGNESGQDTFGNVGNLRIPAQHTAPGTFVNSAGTGRTGLGAQVTGNNPFLNNQFTGVPQQQFPQQNRMIPAATGPAGMNGFGQPNPYGGFPGQQQQQQQQHQSTNLIDF